MPLASELDPLRDPGTPPKVAEPQVRPPRLPIIGGVLVFFAMCLGFLINTPTLIGPDEPFHFDRVIAAAHGDLIQQAGTVRRSLGGIGAERLYVQGWMKRNAPSQAAFPAIPLNDRLSLNDLGGNVRPESVRTNYLTQHPPLYYDVMGAVMWLLPGADDMPVDQLVLILRFVNVLLMLPLPILMWLLAKELFGPWHPITMAAPFLPGLIAGIPRIAATINNDNLAIVIGTAILWLSVRVMRGDSSVRTAAWLSAAVVVGSLTKLTVMALAVIVVLAYVVLWIRSRSFPPVKTIGVMCVGAVLSLAWWIATLAKFGTLVPEQQAWGVFWDKTIAIPRTPDQPPDFDRFWTLTLEQLPRRIWGSLGLHEPPQIPDSALLTLSAAAVVAFVAAMVLARSVRWEVLMCWAMFVLMLALVIRESLNRYTVYTALAGLQGRYLYPAAVGLLLPFAIALHPLARRWTPTVVMALAAFFAGWGLWVSVGYTWLMRGQTLAPDNFGSAIFVMSQHFALPPPTTHILIVLTLAIALIGCWCAIRTSMLLGSRWTSATKTVGVQSDSVDEMTTDLIPVATSAIPARSAISEAAPPAPDHPPVEPGPLEGPSRP